MFIMLLRPNNPKVKLRKKVKRIRSIREKRILSMLIVARSIHLKLKLKHLKRILPKLKKARMKH